MMSSQAVRLTARGRYTNLLTFLGLVVGGYLGFVFLSPRITAYEAKAAVKNGCNEYMRTVIYQSQDEQWKRTFESRMRRIGLNLRSDQYNFDLGSACDRKKCSCHGQAAFALTTQWPLVQDFFPDLPPYRSVHRVDMKVDYRDSY